MQPAIVLRREHQAIAPRPEELLVGTQRVEDAAGPGGGAVDLPRATPAELRDTNRPREAGPVRNQPHLIVRRGYAQERDASPIGGPARLDIEREARVDPAQRALGEGVDADET